MVVTQVATVDEAPSVPAILLPRVVPRHQDLFGVGGPWVPALPQAAEEPREQRHL